MEAPRPVSQVHYYDVDAHGIACGLRGFGERSTKHARAVTCEACLGVLAGRDARRDEDRAAAASAP